MKPKERGALEQQKRYVKCVILYAGSAVRTDDLPDLLKSTTLKARNWMGHKDALVGLAILGGGAGHQGNVITGKNPLGAPLGLPVKHSMDGKGESDGHPYDIAEQPVPGGHAWLFEPFGYPDSTGKRLTGITRVVIPEFKDSLSGSASK